MIWFLHEDAVMEFWKQKKKKGKGKGRVDWWSGKGYHQQKITEVYTKDGELWTIILGRKATTVLDRNIDKNNLIIPRARANQPKITLTSICPGDRGEVKNNNLNE